MKKFSKNGIGKKQVADATLGTTDPIVSVGQASERWFADNREIDVEYELVGEQDAPPLEMTEALENELMGEEKEKEEKQKEIRGKTRHSLNGVNEWRLIARTTNEYLDWEHTTMAMAVGFKGCLVCVKEAIGQKMHSTMTYVPDAVLHEVPNTDNEGEVNVNDLKWVLS